MTRIQNSFGISILLHALLLVAILNLGSWDFPSPKLAIDFSMLNEKTVDETPVSPKNEAIAPKKSLPKPKMEKPEIVEKPTPPPPPKEAIPEPVAKIPPPPPKIDIKPRRPPETIEEKPLEITKKRDLQMEETRLDKIETKRRMMEEARLDTLGKPASRRMEDIDGVKQLGNPKSRTFEDLGSVPRIQTVQARDANDSPANPPTVFVSSKPARRLPDESTAGTAALSAVGGTRTRQDDVQSRSSIKVAAARPGTGNTGGGDTGGLKKIGVPKRAAALAEVDSDKVEIKVDLPKRESPAENEPLKVSAVQTKPERKASNRSEETFHGSWQRIENIGPLAHLNSRCYGQANGSIVVANQYKFKCSDNQIVEAWKQMLN